MANQNQRCIELLDAAFLQATECRGSNPDFLLVPYGALLALVIEFEAALDPLNLSRELLTEMMNSGQIKWRDTPIHMGGAFGYGWHA